MAKSTGTETERFLKAFGWAARDSSGILSPFTFSLRETCNNDVRFKVLYCGICHSDLHTAKAFGAKVTVISTSPSKKEEAIKHHGADSFLVSRDQDQMQNFCRIVRRDIIPQLIGFPGSYMFSAFFNLHPPSEYLLRR